DALASTKARADYVCTGANDTAQIIAAYTALPAAGGTVQLSEGTFTLTGTLTPPAKCMLQGVGKFATVILTTNHSFNLVTFGSNVTLRDLCLRGPGVRDAGTFSKCVNGGSTVESLIEDCVIENACGQGISLADNSNRNVIRNNIIRNNGDEGLYA